MRLPWRRRGKNIRNSLYPWINAKNWEKWLKHYTLLLHSLALLHDGLNILADRKPDVLISKEMFEPFDIPFLFWSVLAYL